MFLKMNLFLIFCVFFSSIKCEDWCSVVTPNGKYEELQITRYWKSQGENDVEYVMFNGVGNEWVFTVTAYDNSYSTQSIRIDMTEGSVRNRHYPNVINRFAIFGKMTGSRGNFAADIRLLKKV